MAPDKVYLVRLDPAEDEPAAGWVRLELHGRLGRTEVLLGPAEARDLYEQLRDHVEPANAVAMPVPSDADTGLWVRVPAGAIVTVRTPQ